MQFDFSGTSGSLLILDWLLSSFWLCEEVKGFYLCLHLVRNSLSISFLNFYKIFLIYLVVPMLGAYMLTVFMCSWWIIPSSILKCPSLSLFMAFVLKSIFSDIGYPATPAFFSCPFAWNIIYLFLDLGEGREKERERNISVWLLLMRPPTADLAGNLDMCPDWESNWWPFGLEAGHSIHLATPARESFKFFNSIFVCI